MRTILFCGEIDNERQREKEKERKGGDERRMEEEGRNWLWINK